MHTKCLFKHFPTSKNRYFCLLTGFWIAGILAGILFSSTYSTGLNLHPIGTLLIRPIPIFLFLSILLPPACVLVANATGCRALNLVTVSFTSVCHGFCGNYIYLVSGNCSWLMRPLFLFSAGFGAVLMWLLLLGNTNRARTNISRDIRLTAIAVTLIFCTDFFLISPLLIDLSKFF